MAAIKFVKPDFEKSYRTSKTAYYVFVLSEEPGASWRRYFYEQRDRDKKAAGSSITIEGSTIVVTTSPNLRAQQVADMVIKYLQAANQSVEDFKNRQEEFDKELKELTFPQKPQKLPEPRKSRPSPTRGRAKR